MIAPCMHLATLLPHKKLQQRKTDRITITNYTKNMHDLNSGSAMQSQKIATNFDTKVGMAGEIQNILYNLIIMHVTN